MFYFVLSFSFISLFAGAEYDIVLLAPKGEELTTERNFEDIVKINDAGYVIGTYDDNGKSISYVYHQKLGYKKVTLPNGTLEGNMYDGIQSINSQGIAVGIYNGNRPVYYYYNVSDPKIFIFNAKTNECYDLLESFGLSEVEGFSLKNIYIKQAYITDDNKVVIDCDYSKAYIYDLNLKTASFFSEGSFIAMNQKGQMIGDGWFYDPNLGVEDLGSLDQFNRWKVEPEALSKNGIVAGIGRNSHDEEVGFLWSLDKGLIPFDILGEYPRVKGVNDKGQVVGYFEWESEDDDDY